MADFMHMHTHTIKLTDNDGSAITEQVYLTDCGAAYTREEWDADAQADWECVGGEWRFQGQPAPNGFTATVSPSLLVLSVVRRASSEDWGPTGPRRVRTAKEEDRAPLSTTEPVTQPGWYTLADDTTRRVIWSRGVARSVGDVYDRSPTREEVELWRRVDAWEQDVARDAEAKRQRDAELARGGY